MTDETGVNALSSGGEEKNGVGVKPLAWHERLKTGDCEGFVCSEGGVLSYSIMLSRFRVYGISGEHDGAAEFPSIEEAKAASQVDYEKRILSALTNTDLSLRAENERLRKERDEDRKSYIALAKQAKLEVDALEAKLEEAAKVLERVTDAAVILIDAAPTRLGCGIHCQAEIEHMDEEAYSAAYGNLDFLLPRAKYLLANLKGAE